MDARRKTSIRLSEDVREGFARVAAKPFGGKPAPAFGADEGDGKGDGKGNPFTGKAPGTPTKRDIPKDHEFDKKAVKPIVQTLWAMSVALGHALTAHRSFSRLKSSTFSPDGLMGGRGYVLPVKDVRSDLFEACEKLSALCDTLHDEINAPHWKPKIAELEKADMDEVERLLGDSEDWIDNPEEQTEEGEDGVEKKPWTKADKNRFEKNHDNFKSNLPDGGDAETVPSQGPHPASPDHPQNSKQKHARTIIAYDQSILGIPPSAIVQMDMEEKQDTLIDNLMHASSLVEAVAGAFPDVMPFDSRSVVLHAAKDIAQVARKIIHTKTASDFYDYNRLGNSSLAPQTEPGGPRVQHLDRADVDQDGPGGSYNRDEKPVSDQWGEEGGVSGDPMSQDSGDSYIYPSDWSGDTSHSASDYSYAPKMSGSSVPDSNTDSTPTQGWDFGLGYGDGDDAHGQGAGGYGEDNPSSGARGVYGPATGLPNDPGGKTKDNEESDSNPIIERSVSESGHMGLPMSASLESGVVSQDSYESVPDANGVLVALDHAELPNDDQDPVARSDYYDGDKGNDFNGVTHHASGELPGGLTPQTRDPRTDRPMGDHEFSAAGELPGDGTSDLTDYGMGGGGGNLMDHVEQGNQQYVKWDDNTHNMKPDYTYQRDPIQGPYSKQDS